MSPMEQAMYVALSSEYGVELEVSDVNRGKQEFYKVRRAARDKGNTEFETLRCRTCPADQQTKIWITKESGNGTDDTRGSGISHDTPF